MIKKIHEKVLKLYDLGTTSFMHFPTGKQRILQSHWPFRGREVLLQSYGWKQIWNRRTCWDQRGFPGMRATWTAQDHPRWWNQQNISNSFMVQTWIERGKSCDRIRSWIAKSWNGCVDHKEQRAVVTVSCLINGLKAAAARNTTENLTFQSNCSRS